MTRETVQIQYNKNTQEPVGRIPQPIMVSPAVQLGEGGALQSLLRKGGPTPYPSVYHFDRNGTPFVDLVLLKGKTRTYLRTLHTILNPRDEVNEQYQERTYNTRRIVNQNIGFIY